MLKSIHSARHILFCESLRRARKMAGLSQQEVAKRLKDIAFYPVLMPPEEFAALCKKDIDLMARAIKIAGLRAE